MKKLGLMSIILIVLIGLAACGNKKEIEPDLPRAIPDEYLGTYYDAIAGRGSLEVSPMAMVMDWSNSAYEHDTTTFLTDYDEENKRINYTGATLIRSTYTSETEHTDETIYDDGTGYFEIKDEKLIWHDDKAEGEPIEFLRNMANVINPWTYTQDLSEAIAASGIEFDPPVSVPEGYAFKTYGGCINGIIEAQYESDKIKMVVRKSDQHKDIELSGNYNSYSKNWNENFKGLNVDCYGDGETINMALFSNSKYNYAINVFDRNYEQIEENGLTVDELFSIIAGMQ